MGDEYGDQVPLQTRPHLYDASQQPPDSSAAFSGRAHDDGCRGRTQRSDEQDQIGCQVV